MLKPSYSDLMQVLNSENENIVKSRYSIVIATAKRARQLVEGYPPMIETGKNDKPLSVAVQEMYDGKIKLIM